MRSLAQIVHRSFRKVEHCADWMTGAAGPLFVGLCIALVSIGMWTFFTSMFQNIAPAPPSFAKLFRTKSPAHIILGFHSAFTAHPWLTARWIIVFASCMFIVYSIGYHYYMAVKEPPGSVLDGLSEALGERRNGPGSEVWWSRHRRRAVGESILALRRKRSDDKRSGVRKALNFLACQSSSDILINEHEVSRIEEGEDMWVQVKMCQKCPKVPLWRALACLPPELRAIEKQMRTAKRKTASLSSFSKEAPVEAFQSSSSNSLNGYRSHESENPSNRSSRTSSSSINGGSAGYADASSASQLSLDDPSVHYNLVQEPETYQDEATKGESTEEIRRWLGSEADTAVPPPKPERTHHCSVCETCILKFDHHCPWLNQCVGIGNERYFVLFMVWLAIGCGVVVSSGWSTVRLAISFKAWPYTWTPRLFPLLTFALCAIMGFALAVMSVWQLLIIGWGETSVENSDNNHYREVVKRKQGTSATSFSNVYDIGFLHNLCLYFNVGPLSYHAYMTVLAPWRIEPYTDGWHFAKKIGMSGRHQGIEPEEELTDDEVERDDAHPLAR